MAVDNVLDNVRATSKIVENSRNNAFHVPKTLLDDTC